MGSLPARDVPRQQMNRGRSWRKSAPHLRRRRRTKGKSYFSLGSSFRFYIPLRDARLSDGHPCTPTFTVHEIGREPWRARVSQTVAIPVVEDPLKKKQKKNN